MGILVKILGVLAIVIDLALIVVAFLPKEEAKKPEFPVPQQVSEKDRFGEPFELGCETTYILQGGKYHGTLLKHRINLPKPLAFKEAEKFIEQRLSYRGQVYERTEIWKGGGRYSYIVFTWVPDEQVPDAWSTLKKKEKKLNKSGGCDG